MPIIVTLMRELLIVESSPNLISVWTEMVGVYIRVKFKYICEYLANFLLCVFMEFVMVQLLIIDNTIYT